MHTACPAALRGTSSVAEVPSNACLLHAGSLMYCFGKQLAIVGFLTWQQ